MTQIPLLDDVAPAIPHGLNRSAKVTARNKRALANGRHPGSGFPVLKTHATRKKRCKTCLHFGVRSQSRSWFKCCLFRSIEAVPHSIETDIRANWPACTMWEAALGG